MWIRRLLWAGAACVLLAVGAVGVYLWSGSTTVESWVGAEMLRMAGGYLKPELKFQRLTYERPRTIVLENATLTAIDPADGVKRIDILAVKQARVVLTEIPQRGKPVRFSEIVLESPQFRAVSAGEGKGFIGFSDLLREKPVVDGAAATAPATAKEPLRLSDFFLMRHVGIINGLIEYDPRVAGREAMRLDGITVGLDCVAEEKNPGVYGLKVAVDRKPIFNLEAAGAFDVDRLGLELSALALQVDLKPENYHVLPPELQGLLKAYEVTGGLAVTAAGKVPFTEVGGTAMTTDFVLKGAGAAVGERRVSIDDLTINMAVVRGVTTIRRADARMLGGTVSLAGEIPLTGDAPMQLRMSMRGVQIEKTLRTVDPGSPPPYAGSISGDVNFSAPLGQWKTAARGNGVLALRQGRIANMPLLGIVIRQLNDLVMKGMGQKGSAQPDSADITFRFEGDRVRIEQLTGQAAGVALRGTGVVAFDQRIDLRLNAGPMEKLQGALGPLGGLWGAMSDALVGYHVTGTIAQPQVGLEIGR